MKLDLVENVPHSVIVESRQLATGTDRSPLRAPQRSFLGNSTRALIPILIFLAAISCAVSPLQAGPGFLPDRWGGTLSLGYDSRPGTSTDDVDIETGTGNGRYWFAEPNDLEGAVTIWSRWKFRSLYEKARLKLSYGRNEWANGGILARDEWSVDFRQELPGRMQIGLDIDYAPQIYVRHRADKDAAPGDPRFRPEAYEEVDGDLTLTRFWSSRFNGSILLAYNNRDETHWFDERDRKRYGVGASFEFARTPGSRLIPLYEYNVSRSRNEPDLGSDLSYRQHIVGLRIRHRILSSSNPWRIDLATRWKFRAYTTDDPDDERRYNRHDRIYEFSATLSRSTGSIMPFLSANTNGRWVNKVVPDAADEDGEIDRLLIRLGFNWEVES